MSLVESELSSLGINLQWLFRLFSDRTRGDEKSSQPALRCFTIAFFSRQLCLSICFLPSFHYNSCISYSKHLGSLLLLYTARVKYYYFYDCLVVGASKKCPDFCSSTSWFSHLRQIHRTQPLSPTDPFFLFSNNTSSEQRRRLFALYRRLRSAVWTWARKRLPAKMIYCFWDKRTCTHVCVMFMLIWIRSA